jgi:hypothetical protein
MNRSGKADWIAWGLQLVVGLVAGGVTALCILSQFRDFRTLDGTLPLISGVALTGGALASFYGDSYWIGDSYHVIPPDEPQHSRLSRLASGVVGFIGVALVALWLARLFRLF